MEKKKLLPLVDRPAPLIKLLKERPVIGLFAETPEEVRSFRRGITSAVVSGLFLAAYAALLVAYIPKPPE